MRRLVSWCGTVMVLVVLSMGCGASEPADEVEESSASLIGEATEFDTIPTTVCQGANLQWTARALYNRVRNLSEWGSGGPLDCILPFDQLDAATHAHASYLRTNFTNSACVDFNGQPEREVIGCPGFTGLLPHSRAAGQGIAMGTNYTTSPDPWQGEAFEVQGSTHDDVEMVGALLNSPHTRPLLLRGKSDPANYPRPVRLGRGYSSGGSGLPGNPFRHIKVMGVIYPMGPDGQFMKGPNRVWPGPGMTGVRRQQMSYAQDPGAGYAVTFITPNETQTIWKLRQLCTLGPGCATGIAAEWETWSVTGACTPVGNCLRALSNSNMPATYFPGEVSIWTPAALVGNTLYEACVFTSILNGGSSQWRCHQFRTRS